ncbi:MAG: ABC transporter permease subunit [Solirubrobacteraceae bacterium]|jgi:ABC-type transport system involved in multi-copper enzyme maturation permease subunit
MLGAFSSEWVKLRRRAMLLWGLGGGLFFALIATIFTIERAVKNPGLFPLRRGRVSFYQLEMPTGLVHGVVDISTLIGIVALCLFAGAFATEFSQGTMRNLLVREPRRAQLLTGKFLAIAVFIGVAVVLEIVVSCAVAFILAPGRGITTSAWTSSTGINDLLQATLHVFLASVGYGMLGAALGVLLRSPGVAIGAAVAYVVAIEGIVVGAIWSNGDRWLPGQLLSAVAHGGTTDSSYHHSLITLAVYMVLIAAGTLIVFTRRDAS